MTDPMALDLGLGPAPTAPEPPQPTSRTPSGNQRLIQLALMGLAGGLGPGAGTGILQGMAGAMQRRRQDAAQQDAFAQQQYARQQQEYAAQLRAFEAEQAARQKLVFDATEGVRKVAATAQSKEEYDRAVETFSGLLQSAGVRLSPNWFRQNVRYTAPSAKDVAAKALDAFMKNPLNKSVVDNPDKLQGAFLTFDRDGDGVPERVPFFEAAELAQMPVAKDASGKLLAMPKGTTPEVKANADGILQSLIEQDRAEGKPDTPQRRVELQKQAIRLAKQAGDTTPNAPAAGAADGTTLPPRVQQRVDAKGKEFNAQPVVKRVQLMAEAVTFADGLDINTTNPADDQALIYAFAKAMDPESVVREGEYATVQKYAQSWAQTYGFNMARIFSNLPFLTPQARANMKATIRAKYQSAIPMYRNVRKNYEAQVDGILGKPGAGKDWLVDYEAAFPQSATPPAGGGAAPTGAPTYQEYLSRRGQAR